MRTLHKRLRRIRWRRPLLFVTATIAYTLAAGCQEILARAIVYAPHATIDRNTAPRSAPELRPLGVSCEMLIDVGPPAARLCTWVVDPPPKQGDPRGTILVLHGVRANKLVMLPVARGAGRSRLSCRAGRSPRARRIQRGLAQLRRV